jgi:hypothetical protein
MQAMPVAQFVDRIMRTLSELGLETRICARPNEVDPAIPFAEDHEHASYDPKAAHLFWGQLLQAARVIGEFRSHFVGKVSPVHFWWINGPRLHPVLRPAGAGAPRWRPERCGLGHGRGLLAPRAG